VLTLAAGFIAILGNTMAGTMSDQFGRRLVLSVCVVVSAASFAAFFAWATGPWLALFWTIALFTFMATDIIIAGLGAELFPTSHRTLASAIRFFAALTGGAIGLLVEAEIFKLTGAHGTAIALLTIVAPLCLIPIWFLPEPAKKSLEDIAAERAP
ncbi:MAG: MFS transporter, partial [Alphaproteobacteria bacterium]|nr:MFS transporter [Alphaproteobacteria bacterium]